MSKILLLAWRSRHYSLAVLTCLIFANLGALAQQPLPHVIDAAAYIRKSTSFPVSFDLEVDSNNILYSAGNGGIYLIDGATVKKIPLASHYKIPVFNELKKDARGRIWGRAHKLGFGILTKNGVEPYEHSAVIKHFDNAAVDDFYQDLEGTLHLAVRSRGYFTVSKEGELKEVVTRASGLHGFVSTTLADGRPFFFYIKSSDGYPKSGMSLYHWDGGETFKKIVQLKGEIPRYNSALLEYENGDRVLSTGGYELAFFRGDSLLQYKEFPYWVITAFMDRDEGLWLGTLHNGTKWVQNRDMDSMQQFMKGSTCGMAAQGRDGELWMKSDEEFFHCIPFINRASYGQEAPEISEIDIKRIVSDGKNVYGIGSPNEVLKFTSDSIYHISVPEFDDGAGGTAELLYPHSAFYDTLAHRLWVGGWGAFLSYDSLGWRRHPIPDASQKEDAWIRDIVGMPDGTVMGLAREGVVHVKNNGNVVYHRQTQTEKAVVMQDLACDRFGKVWIGSANGVWIWSGKDSTYERYLPESPVVDSIQGKIYFITEGMGRIFICTALKGLYVVDGDQLSELRSVKGEAMHMLELVAGNDNDLWGRKRSRGGLCHIEVQNDTLSVSETKTSLGFEYTDFSSNFGVAITEDRGFFLMGEEVFVLKLKDVEFGEIHPSVVLKDIFINFESTGFQSSYDLDYEENSVGFELRSIYYGFSELTFRHRLTGLSDAWQKSEHPSVQYANLDPGEYQFQVDIKSGFRDWIEGPRIKITIQTPFWQTWWFLSLCLLAGIGLIGGAFYLRFRILQRRAQLTIDKLMAEQRTLRSQMNPHFLFNALVSLQDVVFKNGRMEAVSNISKFATLMRRVLSQSTRDVITLSEEIEMLTLYLELESLRFEGQFEHSITIEDGIDPEVRILPPMLIQPFVENAIKHGLLNRKPSGGIVRIVFSQKGGGLHCTIEDNGIGIQKASELNTKEGHQSFSLAAIKERILLLNQQMDKDIVMNIGDRAESGLSGTQVELFLP